MKVIVAGSTTWENAEAIRKELANLAEGSIVIYGDAPGADALGGVVAEELGLRAEAFAKNKKDYQKYKRGAWKSLNERMLASGAELVLAFHPAVEKSKGTKHLLKLAEEAGVATKIVAE